MEHEKRYGYLFSIYRDYIEHQYELMNHRINWYILIQSFLFASCAVMAQASATISVVHDITPTTNKISDYCNIVSIVICCVGIYTTIIALSGIRAAERPIGSLQRRWQSIVEGDEGLSSARATMPRLLVGGDNDVYRRRGVRLAVHLPWGWGEHGS